jgi:hypothetical protein
VNNELLSTEQIVFETEMYNDIFEPVFGQQINLVITSEAGKVYKYSYIHQKDAPRFNIAQLPQGIYKYEASTTLNGKKEQTKGEFTVRALQLEVFNTTADHRLLRELSKKTGGTFVYAHQINDLAKKINSNSAIQKIHSSENLLDIIHLKWIFFLLLGIVTAEWIIRKAMGTGV